MSDPIRTPAEALEAAAQVVWSMCERDDLADALRALASRIAAPDDEALVKWVMQKPSWQMALTDVLEMPTSRANERILVRAVLAALREAGVLRYE